MKTWRGVIIMDLTGYCAYRFRETRSLSIGQFQEMRYNRPLRIIAASLRTLSEMLINAIGPAVAADFFIYFLGLPRHRRWSRVPRRQGRLRSQDARESGLSRVIPLTG